MLFKLIMLSKRLKFTGQKLSLLINNVNLNNNLSYLVSSLSFNVLDLITEAELYYRGIKLVSLIFVIFCRNAEI